MLNRQMLQARERCARSPDVGVSSLLSMTAGSGRNVECMANGRRV